MGNGLKLFDKRFVNIVTARGNTKISAAKKSNQFQMSSDCFIGDVGGQDRDRLFFCKHLRNVRMEITLNKRENIVS